MRLGLRCTSVCVASTCITSLAPMPKASAPMPPWVQVWLSPQTSSVPGRREAQLRPDDVHDALAGLAEVEQLDAALAPWLVAHVAEQRRAGREGLVGAAGLGRDDVVEGGEGQPGLRTR